MPILEEKRIFLALNLPENIKNEIANLIVKLSKKVDYVKWCEPKILHITLQFLGNLNLEKIKELNTSFSRLESRYNQAMVFKLGELNAFPNIYNAKIIYFESKQQSGTSVLKLYKEVLDLLMQLNLEVDLRKWFPHITIGRTKNKINADIFSKYKIENNLLFNVNSFELMESELTASGPIHKVIKSFKF